MPRHPLPTVVAYLIFDALDRELSVEQLLVGPGAARRVLGARGGAEWKVSSVQAVLKSQDAGALAGQ